MFCRVFFKDKFSNYCAGGVRPQAMPRSTVELRPRWEPLSVGWSGSRSSWTVFFLKKSKTALDSNHIGTVTCNFRSSVCTCCYEVVGVGACWAVWWSHREEQVAALAQTSVCSNPSVHKARKVGLCAFNTRQPFFFFFFFPAEAFITSWALRCFPQVWPSEMRSAPQDSVSIGLAAPGAAIGTKQLGRQSCWRVSGWQPGIKTHLPFVMSRCCCPTSGISFQLLIMCDVIDLE